MAFIEVREIAKSYGLRRVLSGVHLSVESGEFVSIVGYSGAGKTTLLSLIAGLQPADAGEVLIDGEPSGSFPADAAIVFQNYSLLPWYSTLENVRLAVEAAFPDWPRAAQTAQAEKYLQMVGLGKALRKRPGQLSGGMRQRVAIARAFAVEPRILFLDEPFGALDALTRATLQQELAQLCANAGTPVTTIMITNSVEEAILLSDRIVPLSRGPAATLGPGIPVEMPRPRSAAALMQDQEALRIRARVIEFLTGFAHGRQSPARQPHALGNRPVAETAHIRAEGEAC